MRSSGWKIIEKYYGNRFSLTKAVDRMSLRVEKGEFVAIMGASGSGKTTLLNCIATIDRVSSGRIYVDGRDITRLRGNALVRFRRDSIGFVFQEFNLLDTMTAYENIALALQIQKVKEKEIRARIAHVANLLGIESIMDKYPYQLSGGQKQRVACARAVVTRPSLILADEPTRGAGLSQFAHAPGMSGRDEQRAVLHHPDGDARRVQRQLCFR